MKQVWECPTCKTKVTTLIPIKDTPRCENHEAHHHKRGQDMKEKK